MPDAIYSSPAVRTIQTATVSLDEMGILTAPVISDELQELSQGDWEGADRNSTYTDDVMKRLKAGGMRFKAPNGESMQDVGDRMYAWTKTALEVAVENEQETIFAYTHRMSILCLAARLHGWDQTRTYQAATDNVSFTTFIAGASGELQLDQLGVPPLPEQV
jgi:broad specificity phosphatase PhoE